jgi:short-subunit dehydrogenase
MTTEAPAGAKRVALVTGASSGIGRAFAALFAADGWTPILVARSADRLEAVAEALRGEHGTEAHVVALDLGEPGAAQRLFDEVRGRRLEVEVLVNNAGFATFGKFAETDFAKETEEINLNVLTLTQLSKLFVQPMIARGSGRICNVASTAAFQPGPMMAVYCATKAYVLSFSEAISNELQGTGVTVTCFCPGATESGFQERASMQESALVKNRKMPDAVTVAAAGYAAMMAGKRLEIPGALNRIGSAMPRFIPRGVILNVARKLLDRN